MVVADLRDKAVRVLPMLEGIEPQPRCGFRHLVGDGSLNLGRVEDDRWTNVCWSLSHAGVGYLRAPLVAAEMAGVICGDAPGFIAPFYKG